MNAPSRREQEARRLSQKSLRQQLCERFEHDYGFDKGRRIIPTIVDDILSLVEQYYGADRGQRPDQIIFAAAHKDAQLTRGKTMAQTRQQAVRLTMIAPDDHEAYAQGATALRARRLVRWLYEAEAQGALLSSADLAYLSGVARATVDSHLRAYEHETGTLLPLRGTVHDASPKITHKAKIVQLYLGGHLPTEIARMTNHSLEAVEHYLRDFELVRELWPRYDVEQIARLMQRGQRVVDQYIEILRQQSSKEEGDTPVREPSVSPQSGSHEPAKETILRSPTDSKHDSTQRCPPRDGLPEVSPQRGGGEDVQKVK